MTHCPHCFSRRFSRGVILIGALTKGLRLPLLREFGRLRHNSINTHSGTSSNLLEAGDIMGGGWRRARPPDPLRELLRALFILTQRHKDSSNKHVHATREYLSVLTKLAWR